jgi:hypothetical protein
MASFREHGDAFRTSPDVVPALASGPDEALLRAIVRSDRVFEIAAPWATMLAPEYADGLRSAAERASIRKQAAYLAVENSGHGTYAEASGVAAFAAGVVLGANAAGATAPAGVN